MEFTGWSPCIPFATSRSAERTTTKPKTRMFGAQFDVTAATSFELQTPRLGLRQYTKIEKRRGVLSCRLLKGLLERRQASRHSVASKFIHSIDEFLMIKSRECVKQAFGSNSYIKTTVIDQLQQKEQSETICMRQHELHRVKNHYDTEYIYNCMHS